MPDDDDLDTELSLHDELSQGYDDALAEIDDDLDAAATDAGAPSGTDSTNSPSDDLLSQKDLSAVDAPDAQLSDGEPNSTDDENQDDDTPDDGPEPIAPPGDLSGDDLAAFESLPRGSQEFLARRYGEMQTDYTQKSQTVAQERESLADMRGMSEVFAPHEQYLRMQGLTPQQYTEQLLAVGQYIRENPQEGIKWLARQNGIALDRLAGDGDDYPAEDAPSDPRLDQVLNRIGNLEQSVTNVAQTSEQQAVAAAQGIMDEFQNATDDSGNLAHPHFETVRGRMSSLMTSGAVSNMSEAYTAAVALTPDLPAQVTNSSRSGNPTPPPANASNGKSTQARINQAKKAASPPSTDAGEDQGETSLPPAETIRDQLNRDWDLLAEESA